MELLNWLLEHGLPEAKSFAPQIETTQATSGCGCGCPSILLHVEEGAPLGTNCDRIISDVVGMTTEGKSIGVLLFQNEGKLTELEVYPLDDIEGSCGFPVLDSLRKLEWVDPSTPEGSKE
jgi:hypothetical protein